MFKRIFYQVFKEPAKKNGFTLVETMIVVAICGLVVMALNNVFNVGENVWQHDLGLLELQQTSRLTFDAMVRELRECNAITINAMSPGNITFNTPSNTNVTYYLNSTSDQIIRQQGNNSTKVLGNNIINLSFCCSNGTSCTANCTGANVLEVQLQAQKRVWRKTITFPDQPLKETIRLRNF